MSASEGPVGTPHEIRPPGISRGLARARASCPRSPRLIWHPTCTQSLTMNVSGSVLKFEEAPKEDSTLNLYNESPAFELTLDDFEMYALRRLKVCETPELRHDSPIPAFLTQFTCYVSIIRTTLGAAQNRTA